MIKDFQVAKQVALCILWKLHLSVGWLPSQKLGARAKLLQGGTLGFVGCPGLCVLLPSAELGFGSL